MKMKLRFERWIPAVMVLLAVPFLMAQVVNRPGASGGGGSGASSNYVNSSVATASNSLVAQISAAQVWTTDGTNIFPRLTNGPVVIGSTTPSFATVLSLQSVSGTEYGRAVEIINTVTNAVEDDGTETGLNVQNTHRGAATQAIQGANFFTYNGSGNVRDLVGIQSYCESDDGIGAFFASFNAYLECDGGFITNGFLFAGAGVFTFGGIISNLYGLYLPDLTQGANNYAISTGLGQVKFGDVMSVAGLTTLHGGVSSLETNATITVVSTGITNNTGRQYRLFGLTGVSILQTNTTRSVGFSRGTITVPSDITLQDGEFVTGSSIAVQDHQAF